MAALLAQLANQMHNFVRKENIAHFPHSNTKQQAAVAMPLPWVVEA
jgi:hypothetical protein